MVIQNSLKILNEISEIEELIAQLEKTICNNKLDIDIDAILCQVYVKSEH